MGLFDVVKLVLGAADEPAKPSMAEITIISSDTVRPSSETQPSQAQG